MRQHSRRHFLRGLGTVIALPTLESLLPRALFAQGQAVTKRVFFVYIPNGAQFGNPASGNLVLPGVLSPLTAMRDYVTLIGGLDLAGARAGQAGDHARAAAAFLTCVQPQSPGPRVQKSFDQILAGTVGANTRFASLTLGTEANGSSDSGYSPSYVTNLSWASPTSPNSKETDPLSIFNRMYQAGTKPQLLLQEDSRFNKGKSIIDFVRAEAKSVELRLGSADKAKLDEYLQSLREMEQRIVGMSSVRGTNKAATDAAPISASAATCTSPLPPVFNGSYALRVPVMYDLAYHAFACGMTRVGSFLLANEGSNVSYGFAGVNGGHHEISHDGSDAGRAKIATIVQWHATQLAIFLARLRATQEDEGNMLDHSLIVFGSGINDGSRHNHDQLPIALIGKHPSLVAGGKNVSSGKAPLANLYVTIAKAMGAPLTTFADSTGSLNLG